MYDSSSYIITSWILGSINLELYYFLTGGGTDFTC